MFAAASLGMAFQEVSSVFEANNPGHEVILNFDGSQRLRTQLEHGATADVFASADWEQMQALEQKSILAGEPVNFASNRLVLMVFAEAGDRGSNSSGQQLQGAAEAFAAELGDLAQPGKRIVLGQPQVPIGKYSETLLEKISRDPSLGQETVQGIYTNVVSREPSVRGVAQKIALGEADGGITYATDALPEYTSQRVRTLGLPDSLKVEAMYPIAQLTTESETTQFIDFVLSDMGQDILRRHGFGPPSSNDGNNF